MIAPPGRFALHLCGHKHESALTQHTSGGATEVRSIGCGCSLFGLKKYVDWENNTQVDRLHGYSAGVIDFSKPQPTLRIWPRLGIKKSDSVWSFDRDQRFYLEDDGGIKEITLPTKRTFKPALDYKPMKKDKVADHGEENKSKASFITELVKDNIARLQNKKKMEPFCHFLKEQLNKERKESKDYNTAEMAAILAGMDVVSAVLTLDLAVKKIGLSPKAPDPGQKPVVNFDKVEKPGDQKEDFFKAVEHAAKRLYKNEKGCWEADYGDGIIMVYIESGEFTIGSNNRPEEKPPHNVYLDGYWMGKHEVTVGQYKRFVKHTGYVTQAESGDGAYALKGGSWDKKRGIDWKNPGFKQEDSHPVVCVSWIDAMKYCKWLSREKDLIFKLPIEALWEKAARGIDSRKFPWGSREPDKDLANFSLMIGKTTPVGFYPEGASPYGLLDLAGNVWEWCADWFGDYPTGSVVNPNGPTGGAYRVLRGGSWFNEDRFAQSACRSKYEPSIRLNNTGFRLAQGGL